MDQHNTNELTPQEEKDLLRRLKNRRTIGFAVLFLGLTVAVTELGALGILIGVVGLGIVILGIDGG